MGRIEEIKKETKEAETYNNECMSDYYYDHDLGRHLDNAIYNVNNLISRLQIAEEALKLAVTKMDKMERQIESEWGDNVYADSENFKYSEEYYRVLRALEQIQKEE